MNQTHPTVSKPTEFSIRINWQSALWLALFIFMIFTRFSHLGDKPYHHDESLYAKYMWNFFVGQGYQYDPMQHGPFMFHGQQVSLFLFGVSNYSMRIFPASMGLFLILAIYLMRKRFEPGVALLMGWLFAINPVFMYFQRFNREDPYYSLFSILIFFFLVLWYQDRKPWQAYAVAASVSTLFCIKENAFVNVFILFTFALLKVLVDAFSKKDGAFVGMKAISDNVKEYPLTTKAMLFVAIWGVAFFSFAMALIKMKSSFTSWDMSARIYWSVVFLFMVGIAFLFVYLGEKRRETADGSPSFYRDGYVFALSVIIFAAIFIVLYTTFFTNTRNGFWGGVYKWFEYWWNQHSIARIKGPFHYYHHLMLIYSFTALAVVLIGMIWRTMTKAGYITSMVFILAFAVLMVAAHRSKSAWPFTKAELFTNEHLVLALIYFIAGTFCVMTYIRERAFMRGFLVWWSVMAYLIYSYLQEKVPWLVMHIITPMIILTAVLLMDVFRNKRLGWRRGVMIGLFAVMMMYCFHTSIQLCWYNEADPTEQLVYVQTTYEVPKMISELEEMGFWTNQGNSLPICIDGDATWPFYWYLRDWKNVMYGKNPDPNRHVAVICNWGDRHLFADKLGDRFIPRRYGLRAWYLPNRSHFSQNWLREAWRWVVLRERFNPSLYGETEVCMFVRKDFAKFEKATEIGEKQAQPQQQQRAEAPESEPISMKAVQEIGRFGTGSGQFNEPKDAAVGPSGEIFVSDSKNHRIQKFKADGSFELQFGSFGKEPGQFNEPRGLTVDASGNVIVADTWNHRIQKFAPDGKFILEFGDSNTFWAPKDVIADASSAIYVVDTGFHRIHKYSASGSELWKIGSKGEGKDQFTEPVGIALDKSGKIYVADTANKRISVFDATGAFVRQIPVFGWEFFYTEPYIAIDETIGEIYVSDSKNNRLEIFDLSGKFKAFWGEEGSTKDMFKNPVGVTIASNKIFVVDSMNHRVQVFNAEKH